jgi:hypothetical protein
LALTALGEPFYYGKQLAAGSVLDSPNLDNVQDSALSGGAGW